MAITSKLFGTCNGACITEFVMENENGMCVSVLDRGGIIRSITVPDKNGNPTDVALALGAPDDYEENHGYIGSAIGRYANRLQLGELEIGGKSYKVGINDGNNSLHGGVTGFDKKTWKVEPSGTDSEPELVLKLHSPDGEEGFPGNLDVEMHYKLTADNSLVISYLAVSDKDTVVNLTNHSYFNLAGHKSGVIDSQRLKLNCSFYTPNTDECMPYGEIHSVEGTPFDFRKGQAFGEAFESEHPQITLFGGVDHNFIIDGAGYRCFAVAECDETGICMECMTDKPGVQLYTGNCLDFPKGKDGGVYSTHCGFCLETQFYPNPVKYSHFPSPVLKAGEKYSFTTAYKFYIK